MSKEALLTLDYIEGEDGMMYPALAISKQERSDRIPAGKYGRIWKDYMSQYNPERLMELIMRGEINQMITEVDEEAEAKKETFIQKLLEQQPLPETGDLLGRAAHMEMLTHLAEEVILREVVCQVR